MVDIPEELVVVEVVGGLPGAGTEKGDHGLGPAGRLGGRHGCHQPPTNQQGLYHHPKYKEITIRSIIN